MPELSQFPSAEMQFDRDGNIVGSIEGVLDVAKRPCTDLIVMSHGWNNEAREARELYAKLAASMRAVLQHGRIPALQDRKIALVGVVWPSKKFAEEDGSFGGAAGAGSPAKAREVIDQINGLRDVFPDRESQRTLDSLAALVPQLEDQATARKKFADEIRTLVNPAAADDEDATKDLLVADGGELMDRLAKPIKIQGPRRGQQDGAAGADGVGGAAGLGDLLRGPLGAAKRLLNFTTFFEMKARAGVIGARGVAPVLVTIRGARPDLNVHLVGHSFGARVVSAAAKQLPKDSVATITLLQGAFSHHGFARDFEPGRNGFFREVVDKKIVRGPIIITKTANDKAVGLAYAVASRVSNDAAAGVGDAGDKFGGIGRNGAVKTAEAKDGQLLAVGGGYAFQPRALHNLLADEFVKDHSDVKGPQVAYAVLSAVATT
jgi:pimeloyl-ACP methyl ester carboxylesterase